MPEGPGSLYIPKQIDPELWVKLKEEKMRDFDKELHKLCAELPAIERAVSQADAALLSSVLVVGGKDEAHRSAALATAHEATFARLADWNRRFTQLVEDWKRARGIL